MYNISKAYNKDTTLHELEEKRPHRFDILHATFTYYCGGKSFDKIGIFK